MLTLKRVEIGDAGAFGVLQWYGRSFAVTLEHTYPELGNMPKISEGVYECVRSRFNKGGYDTWKIVGGIITPEREIKFHIGNVEPESEGCPLTGEEFGWLRGGRAVLASGRAFRELMSLTSEFDRLKLAVVNV